MKRNWEYLFEALQKNGQIVSKNEVKTVLREQKKWAWARAQKTKPIPESFFYFFPQKNEKHTKLDLGVLHNSEHFLALLKPPGIQSTGQKPYSSPSGTVTGEALSIEPALENIEQAGLLYRLDVGTSGIVLFCKNQSLWEMLRSEWRSATWIKKYYTAKVSHPEKLGDLPKTVAHALEQKTRKKVALSQNEKKMARTHLLSLDLQKNLLIQLETGSRHQIRAHLSSIGCPIVGDTHYNGPSSTRLFLHCSKIKISNEEFPLLVESKPTF